MSIFNDVLIHVFHDILKHVCMAYYVCSIAYNKPWRTPLEMHVFYDDFGAPQWLLLCDVSLESPLGRVHLRFFGTPQRAFRVRETIILMHPW